MVQCIKVNQSQDPSSQTSSATQLPGGPLNASCFTVNHSTGVLGKANLFFSRLKSLADGLVARRRLHPVVPATGVASARVLLMHLLQHKTENVNIWTSATRSISLSLSLSFSSFFCISSSPQPLRADGSAPPAKSGGLLSVSSDWQFFPLWRDQLFLSLIVQRALRHLCM